MSDVAVEGVISGPAGGASETGDVWYLVLELSPWRHPDGHVESLPLRLEHRVGTHRALKRAMKRWTEGMAVRVATHKVTPPDPGGRWWNTAGAIVIAKTTADQQLADAWRKSLEPVVVQDATLGRFTVDRQIDAFVGKRRLGSRRYGLLIGQSTGGTPAAQVRAARTRVAMFEREFASIVEAITDDMLERYNTTWRWRELSRARFAKQMRLESADVSPGRTTLYVNAGGLFTDHVIEVQPGVDGSIQEILLAG